MYKKQLDERNIVEYNRNIRNKDSAGIADDINNVVKHCKNDQHEDRDKTTDKAARFEEMAIEILKKSDVKGSTDKMAREFIRIYNTLKTQLSDTSNIQIPRQTVFYDYIICLEDGKKMQMLQRHLKVKYNMTFQDYKQKWNLPIDYPSTCKKYSEIRAAIVKKRKNTTKTGPCK